MKDLIVRRPLLSFFVLAYLLSWLCWVPLIFGEAWDPDLVTLVMLFGVLGPMAAAIIVSRPRTYSGSLPSSGGCLGAGM